MKGMKYKPMMVNERAYSSLSSAKDILRAKTGEKTSISDTIEKIVGRWVMFEKIDEKLKDYINLLVETLRKNEHTLGLVLFGSVAKGTYRETSDIDVFIVIDGDMMEYHRFLSDVHDKMLRLEEEFVSEHKYFAFSPFVVESRDLDVLKPIYFEIRDYGLVLYEKNGAISKFFGDVDKVKYERRLTAVGEMVKWKD